MTDNLHTQVNVTRNCLLEFLDILYESKCHDICVTYSDYGWHVQYESPFVHNPEVKKDAVEPEGYVLPKSERLKAVGPLCCQSCVKIKACRQTFIESGVWPVPHDCFVPDHAKKYPQFEMDSCEDCNVIQSCIARYDMNRANWKCAKGKVHLNFTQIQDAPCTPQMIAEADCEGDRAKCGDACHAKSK